MIDNLREILTEIGYDLRDYGREFRARPLYRESDNETVLSIKKDTGYWVDYKQQMSGQLEDLVKLTLNLSNREEAVKYLSQNFNVDENRKIEKPLVKEKKYLSKDCLNNLISDHSYWLDRGVSKTTLGVFKGGIMLAGRMKNRYAFPIFDCSQNLVGMSGRYINEIPEESKTPKWKHIGNKTNWKYPLQINYKILKDMKKVILVESIGDMLSLWEAGIKNVMVIFGLDVSVAVLNTLLRIDPDKIYISLNNDASNNHAGNVAAEKVEKKLLKYFNSNQTVIKLPDLNDFGDMSTVQIHKWAETL
jgi:DNA primase